MRIINKTLSSSNIETQDLPEGTWEVHIQAETATDIDIFFLDDDINSFTIKSGTVLQFFMTNRNTKNVGFQGSASDVVQIMLSPHIPGRN